MTNAIVVKAIAEKTGKSQKAVKEMLNAMEPVLLEILKSGQSFKIMDVTVGLADVEERTGRNPQTGEPVVIPAHKKVSFKASKGLKDAVK